MRKYRLVAKKGEGTFSEVLKAQNVKDGKYHAIKCMKNRFESIDQVNNLREIQALRRLSPHEHIITLEEVLYDQPTGRLALVFELMDANLYELIRGRRHYLNPQLIKSYMWQLMKSLDHMHKKGIFHRDIKPENILIESSTDIGRGLKLADFGSCRGIYSKQPYTEYISTRWYRAPECLLTDGYYGPEMDLWGAGCVMFEITSLYPLFPGSNEVDQISRIHKVLGTPGQEILQKFKSKGASHISFDFPQQKGLGIPQLIPHAPADGVELMVKLLRYDASERISAREAMRHPYFRDIREQEARLAGNVASQATSHADSSSNSIGGRSGGSNATGKASYHSQGSKNKALPTIVGQSTQGSHDGHGNMSHAQSQYNKQLQQQQQGGVNSNLPPIGANGSTGGAQYNQQHVQMQHQQQLMQQQQQLMQQQKQQQSMGGKKYGNTQAQLQQQQQQQMRRRKKYRTNQNSVGQSSYQQQASKRQQGDSNFKAYGVPKAINGVVQQGEGGAGGGAGGAGGGGAGGGRQGGYQHPNRQYVKRY